MVGKQEPGSSADNTGTAEKPKVVALHWFRQDLRIHDNPAMLAALDGCDEFYPVFIFDGKVASKYHIQYKIQYMHNILA